MRISPFLRVLLVALAIGLVAPASPLAVAGAASCTSSQGQALIAQGRLEQAVRTFGCVIDDQPTGVDGYRGRIEAELLLARYSDAVLDAVRLNAFAVPAHPDAAATISAGYAARVAADPTDRVALTGSSFARWWFFDYAQAKSLLERLVELRPNDPYGRLFLGSSRLLGGGPNARGAADLDRAIALDPANPHVRYIVADAYTYGLPDPARALTEATFALDGGLDTPRIEAILGAVATAQGDDAAAAMHIARHIDMVTTDLRSTAALTPGGSLELPLVPGRTYEVPVAVAAGQTLSIDTRSRVIWDSIAVVLAPDGTPVIGSDDGRGYMAAIAWVAPVSATYRLRVTSFESVDTATLEVSRGQ